MPESLYNYFSVLAVQTLNNFSLVLPRIAGALLAFSLGYLVAKISKRILVRILQNIRFSSLVKNSPLSLLFETNEIGKKTDEAIGTVFYWLVMLVVIYTTVSILGLESLTLVLARVLAYIPKIISAVFILIFGVLLAGWIENLVKGSVKSIDLQTSILAGKISSYLVMSVVVLTALSELGIARSFITILFIGLIGTVSLGLGLALGLGGQDLVKKVLDNWYQRNFPQAKTSKKKGKNQSKY